MTLKVRNDSLADARSSGDDASVLARDEDMDELKVRPQDQEKVRKCLICQEPFPSAWAGERVCRRCKSTSAWRSGTMG